MRYLLLVLSFLPSITFAQGTSELKITRLTGDLYVYTTYQNSFPANGMYLITEHGAVMVDTPWDTTQLQPLLDSIRVRHHKGVYMCIATHSHEDRTGGLEYYKQKGIKTFTTRTTDEISKKTNKKRAQFLILNDTTFRVGQYVIQTYYPGEGHTPDNIVVWFSKNRVLYGGCLVKSVEAADLGYIAEANLSAYPTTIKNLEKKFPRAKIVVPGHQSWRSTKALDHTLDLLRKQMQSAH